MAERLLASQGLDSMEEIMMLKRIPKNPSPILDLKQPRYVDVSIRDLLFLVRTKNPRFPHLQADICSGRSCYNVLNRFARFQITTLYVVL
jgi:hypothetical protein